jgi:hypothetical protein
VKVIGRSRVPFPPLNTSPFIFPSHRTVRARVRYRDVAYLTPGAAFADDTPFLRKAKRRSRSYVAGTGGQEDAGAGVSADLRPIEW